LPRLCCLMLGLYLHIPFCQRKCAYCDFFSVVAKGTAIDGYSRLLEQQLERSADHAWVGPVSTVYFGGGTPSLLSPGQVECLLDTAHRLFRIDKEAEITLEANPGTLTEHHLAGYRKAGVNRLSIGLQSAQNHQLQALGRLHDRSQGFAAVEAARKAGFDNISLDLMFALPGQSRGELEEDLADYLALNPEHLSCYGLTAEDGTPLHRQVIDGKITLPDEEFYADAFMLIHDRLSGAGYMHYEIANYAREGFACKHNLNYWRRQPYLGIGAGAHSFFPDNWGSRWQIPNDLEHYQEALRNSTDPAQCLETFTRDSAMRETVYLALRTHDGINETDFLQRFGLSLEAAFPEAVRQNFQWLTQHNGNWSFTVPGWLLFDRLIMPFL